MKAEAILRESSEKQVQDDRQVEDQRSEIADFARSSRRAAVWARISGGPSQEVSLPSQVYRCKEKLEPSGCVITHTFEEVWSSLDLFASPKFQELRSLIKSREIEVLAVLDRDRLEAQGLQRLIFLSECKEAGVELVLCQGPSVIDAPEGQIVELALAIGKERSVLRARQGSRDGLHDRAVKRHLPVTYRRLYGYNWDKENNRLIPNADYPHLKLIFDMVLEGKSYLPVLQELKRRGILSPSGQPEWNKTTLSGMLHNPTYAGRFYALKVRACEPTQRPKKSSRVNSSQKRLTLDEAHYMPNILVIDPLITWEQRERIFVQLAEHQKLSQRNAKRDYLLRGLIVCGEHYGKQGEPRRYHGRPHYGTWCYVCPVGGCTRPFIKGPVLEDLAKFYVKCLFIGESNDFYPLIRDARRPLEIVDRELREWKAKYDRKTQQLATEEYRLLSGEVDKDTCELVKIKLIVERGGIERRIKELLDEKHQIGREREAAQSLEQLAMKYRLGLLGSELTNDEWRNLFIALNLRVKVGVPGTNSPCLDMRDISIEVGIPLSPSVLTAFPSQPKPDGPSRDIVFVNPEPG